MTNIEIAKAIFPLHLWLWIIPIALSGLVLHMRRKNERCDIMFVPIIILFFILTVLNIAQSTDAKALATLLSSKYTVVEDNSQYNIRFTLRGTEHQTAFILGSVRKIGNPIEVKLSVADAIKLTSLLQAEKHPTLVSWN